MEERMNQLRKYMSEPILKKLELIEKRLQKVEEILNIDQDNSDEIIPIKNYPKPKLTTIKNAFLLTKILN